MKKPCKQSEYGTLQKNGYYMFGYKVNGQSLVHRWVYQVTRGVDLTSDQQILHSCDNSWCIEPTHLRMGTDRDNSDDRIKFGSGRGINAKLTEEDIREIRKLAKNYTQQEIANSFGVTRQAIGRILRKETWGYVK